MPREMLKLRKGDSAIMIKADGSMELAGMDNKPLIDENGRLSPIILFAAAWAKKDQATMNVLLTNFKAAVRKGYFGQDAKADFEKMEKRAASATTTMQSASGATTMETPKPKGHYNEDKTKWVEDGVEYELSETEEETAKRKKEEENLWAMKENAEKQNADPVFQKQREKLKQGATIIDKGPNTQHLEPDLPVEQTMAYRKATPEEQEQMRNAASGAVTLEPVVGSATIEEQPKPLQVDDAVTRRDS